VDRGKPSVFISYSRKNIECAAALVTGLLAKGHEVWWDKKDIRGGANYFKKIAEGIKNARIFIPLLSPDSVGSVWVAREVYFACKKQKDIVPVIVEYTDLPDDLELALGGLHYVTYTGRASCEPEEHIEAALDELHGQATGVDDGQSGRPAATSPPAAGPTSPDRTKLRRPKVGYGKFKTFFEKTMVIRRTVLAVIATTCLVLGVGGGIAIGRYLIPPSLPDPADIKVPNVTAQTQEVIRMAYTTAVKGENPWAAAAIVVRRGGAQKDTWRVLSNREKLSSAGRYFMEIRPQDKPAHFYIFQIDSRGKLDWLFPKNPCVKWSSGRNPVGPGRWTRVPGQRRAFFLDENLGVEHFYIVATRGPWPEFSRALLRACRSGTINRRIQKNLNLATRGSAGAQKADVPLRPGLAETMPGGRIEAASPSVGATRYLQGRQGVLVMEKWLHHVAPK
jgi:hypothetical protein